MKTSEHLRRAINFFAVGTLIGGFAGLFMRGPNWWALANAGVTLLLCAAHEWQLRRERNAELKPFEKHYPPGCTCIRGALTDSRTCPIPEHRSTL